MKLKIDNEQLAEEFFENTHLLGIVAPVKSYQFIWHINQQLEIELRKKSRNYFFEIYEHQIPRSCLFYYLYHNQHNGEYLLPEFKHLDFLWLIKGDDIDKEELDSLQQSIRQIPAVQLVNEMTNEKIKNKQHLIF